MYSYEVEIMMPSSQDFDIAIQEHGFYFLTAVILRNKLLLVNIPLHICCGSYKTNYEDLILKYFSMLEQASLKKVWISL